MKLNKINLGSLIAVGHEDNRLGLLCDRADGLEYIEVRAPQAAYEGLQQVADIANETIPVIPMQTLESSCVAAVGYDRDRAQLHVEFVNGSHYQYEAVEPETWQDFRNASSPGQFYNRNIKGQLKSQRLD